MYIHTYTHIISIIIRIAMTIMIIVITIIVLIYTHYRSWLKPAKLGRRDAGCFAALWRML